MHREAAPQSVFTWPFLLAVVVLWTAGLLRLFYTVGSGEHDTFMIAAGVVRGARTGEVLNPSCYGPGIQFLFFYLFRLATLFWTPSTGEVLRIMNVVGALSGLATPLLLATVFGSLMHNAARARLAVLLFMVSPLYFFTVSYGHPFSLALPVFLLSWVILRPLAGPDPDRLGWIRIIAAAAIQSIALMIRFEQVSLFAGLMIGMLALVRHRLWRRWLIAGGIFLVAVFVFMLFGAILVTDRSANASYTHALLGAINATLVKWGSAHLLSEVGLPFLIAGAWVLFRSAQKREFGILTLAIAGILPTVAVYIGNPSPPRHFYVAALGLASLIAAGIQTRWISRMTMALPIILAANLVAPWALMLVDGRKYPDRAVVSYNVLERTGRNKAQIRAAFPFYESLLKQAHGRKVVVFGSWIHVAELMAYLTDRPDTRMEREPIGRLGSALVMRGAGFELYAVETYDARYVAAVVEDFRRIYPDALFVSLVEGGPGVNESGLLIPAEIYWWAA
jgi:hypothetical protein